MSNDLQMTYVMLRLNRWGVYVRWLQNQGGSDPTPKRVTSWMGKLIIGRVEQTGEASVAHSAVCPVDIDEAKETQRCVLALAEWAQQTVVEDYLVGGTAAQKAEALCIDERNLRRRRGLIHAMLLDLFNLAAAGLPLTSEQVVKMGRPHKVAVAA